MLAIDGADRLTSLKAFVVTTRQPQDDVKSRLLPYKYPRIVTYVNELPKTGSGKIDRQSLLKNEPAALSRQRIP